MLYIVKCQFIYRKNTKDIQYMATRLGIVTETAMCSSNLYPFHPNRAGLHFLASPWLGVVTCLSSDQWHMSGRDVATAKPGS